MKTEYLGLSLPRKKILIIIHHLGSCRGFEQDNKDDTENNVCDDPEVSGAATGGRIVHIDWWHRTPRQAQVQCVFVCVRIHTHTARRKRDCRCTHTLHGGREIVDIIMKNALPRDTGSGPPGHNYVNCTSFYSTSSSNRLTRMNDSLPLNLFPASWVVATTTPTTSTTHR